MILPVNNAIYGAKYNDEQTAYWNCILSHLNININSLWLLFSRSWFNKTQGKYLCKNCNVNLSLFHAEQQHIDIHCFLNSDGMKWINEIADTYEFTGSLLRRKIHKNDGAKWIKRIM